MNSITDFNFRKRILNNIILLIVFALRKAAATGEESKMK